MPWRNRPECVAPHGAWPALCGLVAVQAAYLIWLFGLAVSGVAVPLVVSCLLAGGLCIVRAGTGTVSRRLYALLWMCVAGHAGLLVGAWLDFGPLSLLMLLSWCRASAGLGFESVLVKLSVAPLSYIGMLAGSVAGMWVAGRCSRPDRRRGDERGIFHAFCGLGMMLGMFAAEMLMPASVGGVSGVALMSTLMLCGMAVGTCVSWSLMGWVRHRIPATRHRSAQ